MKRLILRSATYHWRTNLAVCLGVAAAVAVLGGALLVGDSVRGSLRDLALSRLGRTQYAVSSAGYFREALAEDLAARASVRVAPVLTATAAVTHEPSSRRASGVLVYGVDERFWRFHGMEPREGVLVSPALARELGAGQGDVLLTRLQKPSAIPLESLFAHKDDAAQTVRLTTAGTLERDTLGEFSLQPQQAEVRALFAPLRRLQRDLGVPATVNTLLVDGAADEGALERAFDAAVTLADLGVTIDAGADGATMIVSSDSGIVPETLERAAREAAGTLGLSALPIFTYLANTIRIGDAEVPYSLVTGVDLRTLLGRQPRSTTPSAMPDLGGPLPGPGDIVLNDWAARELRAKVGDRATIEYYLWDPAAGLQTRQSAFSVTAIVPMIGLAADRRLTPEYPGITSAQSLSDWDPPFPIDLSRVRKQDEQYWDVYRATPKAFIGYDAARELWATRYGNATSIRFSVPPGQDPARPTQAAARRLDETVTPASQGVVLLPVRERALAGSTGATNFGEYFAYFSFFIVVSALLLTTLFFRLGVEQRLRQIGILRACGYTTAHIRRMLLAEGVIVAAAGSAAGIAGAVAYAEVIVYGLRTWWVGAVGTTLLAVHVNWISLAAGAAGGLLTALLCVLLSLRSVARRSPRALLHAFSLEPPAGADPRRARRAAAIGAALAVLGLGLMAFGYVSRAAEVGAFFGAGAALLSSALFFLSSWLRARNRRPIGGRGVWAVSRLGFRGAAFRPGRTVLSAALVACAAFIIVSVDAFRRGGGAYTTDTRSGTGGYALLAKSEVPVAHNLNDPAGREAAGVQAAELARVRFSRFRLRPGEDASCLNLYRPANPTIIAPERAFVERGRFSFAATLAESDAEKENPWLLLDRTFADGSVPAIADATSLQYVLHASVGDTMSIDIGAAAPLVLRFVGALRDSVLQGELTIGEPHFLRLFPGEQGFRFFLIDAPEVTTREQAASLATVVERELQPFALDAVSTVDRLDAFHRVENTYLSTFQALGGLGLLLGTIGLATVMFRNVLERRRELALLRAVGYNASHVTTMIAAEAAFLLAAGLLAGVICAVVAIAPAWLGHSGSAPGAGLILLLSGVAAAGLLSSIAATRAAVSGGVLEALRSE